MARKSASKVKLLNGKMPDPSVISQEIGQGNQLPFAKVPEDVSAAIDPDWIVQLLHEHHPEYDGTVFVVKMTSRWGATKPVFFLPSDLYDKKKLMKLTQELVNRGRFLPDETKALIDYVDYLKVAGPGMITPDDGSFKQHIMGTTELSNEIDWKEYYKLIVEYIEDNRSVFPDQTSGRYDDTWSHGVHLNEEKSINKFGLNAFAFVPHHLQTLLEIGNRNVFGAVLDKLVSEGLLFCGGGKSPRKDISVPLSPKVTKKVYVFTHDSSVLSEGDDLNG